MRKLRRLPKSTTRKRRAPARPLSQDDEDPRSSIWPGDGEDGIDAGGDVTNPARN
jgi:hypothetical protein